MDRRDLQAALVGYEAMRQDIDNNIRRVRSLLGLNVLVEAQDRAGKAKKPQVVAAKPAAKRSLSAAARKRISEAQKKRWAEWHKQAAAAG